LDSRRSAETSRTFRWFDRPFLFVLRDKKTGLALFVGRVTDPG
jgi:serine protease inhibitor